jgi:hypothetical protein
MKFKVLTAVKMSLFVFWIVTLSGLVYVVDTTVSMKRTICISEMLVSTYKPPQHFNPEDRHWQALYSQYVSFVSHSK